MTLKEFKRAVYLDASMFSSVEIYEGNLKNKEESAKWEFLTCVTPQRFNNLKFKETAIPREILCVDFFTEYTFPHETSLIIKKYRLEILLEELN